MYAADPDKWVVKGGYAMILRLDPNRTSNDIDVSYIDQAGEHAVALRALERAMANDLEDFFSFEIVRVGDETPDRARRVTVLCRLGAREFSRFRVDLDVPTAEIAAERIEAPPLTCVEQIDEVPPVMTLAWPQQIADKICAIFESHGDRFSSRVRDLADLALISHQVDGLSGDEMIAALRAEEERRRPRSLPHGLPKEFALPAIQKREWSAGFERATRGARISFDDALAATTALAGPLLEGSAAGRIWNPTKQSYQ